MKAQVRLMNSIDKSIGEIQCIGPNEIKPQEKVGKIIKIWQFAGVKGWLKQMREEQ